ncbi:MAG: chemotaxis-specific protein-glutamate methyltransferase CheB [Phycisphaerales bacterium]
MIRVAIVNDLRLAVETLRRAVDLVPDATVAWIAVDGREAVDRCRADLPDVILMDMVMPVMDGVAATREIMRSSPCPILVVTATVEGNASQVFDALGAGALDAVATPKLGPDGRVRDADAIVRKIRNIALLAGTRAAPLRRPAGPDAGPGSASVAPALPRAARSLPPMIAVGASTGGPQALSLVLRALPRPLPWAAAIVQHVDPSFANGLAEWLARETGQRVETVRDGDALVAGRVALAATSDHMVVDAGGALRYVAEPRSMVFRPSADVFFASLADERLAPGVAVVLTGMGRDGAEGLKRLRAAGWHTIAQDRATSVVWGMPGAAVEIGAAMEVLPMDAIGAAIGAAMQRVSHERIKR